jgi:hypothetical protein
MSRLRETLDLPIGVRTLYEAPTISALAEYVAATRWAAEGRDSSSVQDAEQGVL